MKRKLLTTLARTHRAESRGAGAGRRTVQGWVWATKLDLWQAWQERERARDEDGLSEVTAK